MKIFDKRRFGDMKKTQMPKPASVSLAVSAIAELNYSQVPARM